jgi:trk system potassium uptake protein TrkH
MTFSTFAILIMGKSISLSEKTYIENDFTAGIYKDVKDLLIKIVVMTFSIEILGAALLYHQFSGLEGSRRLFAAVFHSISAFCNAGFSIFSNNFENYTSHWGVNLTIMFLIIAGGIGFLVLNEIGFFLRRKIKRFSRFSLHTKLVLISSAFLILAGFLVILTEEILNKGKHLSFGAKVLSSLFQSVSARTAGFNTVGIGSLSYASVFIILLLMFIGASPGSTGGGIKTTSVSVVIAYFRSLLQGKDRVDIFYRNLSGKIIEKAFIVVVISFLLISVFFFIFFTLEPNFGFGELLF